MDRLRPVFRWSPFRWGTKRHRSSHLTTVSVITTAVLALAMALAPTSADAAGPRALSDKQVITSIDQLPRHTYDVSGSVVGLLESEDALLALGAELRADLVKDLETYDIKDDTALQQYHGALANLDLLVGDYDGFFAHTDMVRKLEEKPASKLMTGLVTGSAVEAKRDPGATDEDAYRQRFREILAARVAAMPWDLVEDQVEHAKGQMEIISANLLIGLAQNQIDPAVQSTGQMSGDVAGKVVNMAIALQYVIPVKDDAVAILQEAIDANRTEKIDIWPAREVAFPEKDGLAPVLVAVWDTGVDTEVFSDRLFVNPRERFDGTDTDGNGFVDDVNGIAYDLDNEPTPELLYPIDDTARALELQRIKGFFDLQAAVESPEAKVIRTELATMQPADVPPFFEGLMQCAIYVHGTHVGGIAVEGNPSAEVLTARLTADHRMIPEAPTVDRARKVGRQFLDSVDYFKTHGVQVVNMSWGMSVKDEETALERNGIGETPEERQTMAREMFDIARDALYEALQNAPDILFVAAAGNEDNDVTFDDEAPAAFDLPNVMIVGAVDQAGEPTGFTSFGETVDVYANGFEVKSFVPGGERMAFSGTSMASPNAANLAAKLLALDPSLTPEELIELIIRGSDRYDGDERVLLINPKRTVELLRSREG